MKKMNVLNRFFEKVVAGGAFALAMMIFGSTGQAATITVTSNADAGAGTLRQAILDSNASAGVFDTINFVVTTIAPVTPLPAITDPVMIDGGTAPTVELNGTGAGISAVGLYIRAGGTTVRGMIINRFGGPGIRMDTDGAGVDNGNTIIGNFIGTSTTGNSGTCGAVTCGNANRGILIVATTGHLIGGTTAADRNVISNNGGPGIQITAGGSATISGNHIGPGANGTSDLGNTLEGVSVVNSSGSVIGGLTAGARNVISGNLSHGIIIVGDVTTPASNNTVMGNYIGVDSTGNTALRNDGSGVAVQDASNVIGGAAAGARNVISGNGTNGVSVSTTLATANVVAGNFIGVGANGTTAIQNLLNGVAFSGQSHDNLVGGADVTAGLCNNSCNTIANNGNSITTNTARAGIYADVTAGNGNQFRGNAIFTNGFDPTDIGIDLAVVGATANDASDPDLGPNNTQNKPVISSASTSGVIVGTLNSNPSTSFVIEFFRNLATDTAVASEGRVYIGSTSAITDGSGNAAFNFTTTVPLTAGQVITATATRAVAPFDTSEFSDAQLVAASPGGPGSCTPTTTVTEGDLFPGGLSSFGVSSGPGSVTVDHVNAGTGLQSFTVVSATNAVVIIPPFTPGTYDPVTATFTVIDPSQPVDFTLRAASTFHSIFIRVRCGGQTQACTPNATVTEGDLFPGGLSSFGVSSGPGSVTVDHVNAGTGLQSFTVVSATNAIVTIPAFTPGTYDPVTATYTITDPNQPVDFTLRAASSFHSIFIRVRCSSTLNTFSGRATAINATIAGINATLVDTGPLPATGGFISRSLLSANLFGGALTTGLLTATTQGAGDQSRSQATTETLNLLVGGNTIASDIVAESSQCTCTANGPVCEGSFFGNLRINGVTIAITGQANQTVNLVGGGTVVINEQTFTGSGNAAGITANGLHVIIPGVADVIISSAHSDIVCALTP